jgi:hypothetical protein
MSETLYGRMGFSYTICICTILGLDEQKKHWMVFTQKHLEICCCDGKSNRASTAQLPRSPTSIQLCNTTILARCIVFPRILSLSRSRRTLSLLPTRPRSPGTSANKLRPLLPAAGPTAPSFRGVFAAAAQLNQRSLKTLKKQALKRRSRILRHFAGRAYGLSGLHCAAIVSQAQRFSLEPVALGPERCKHLNTLALSLYCLLLASCSHI